MSITGGRGKIRNSGIGNCMSMNTINNIINNIGAIQRPTIAIVVAIVVTVAITNLVTIVAFVVIVGSQY